MTHLIEHRPPEEGLGVLLDRAREFHAWTLQAEGKARATIANYGTAQRLYITWCATVLGVESPTLAALTVSNARAFLRWLEAEHRSPRIGGTTAGHGPVSVRYYARVLKIWAAFLVREGMLPDDPLRRLALPKVPRTVHPALTPEDFALLLRLTASKRDRWRNRALLLFMAETGVRVSELCGLRMRDIELATNGRRGRALVMGKGARQRWVGPIDGETSRAIAKYWQVERPRDAAADWAFLGKGGVQLTPRAVQALLLDLERLARLNTHVTPHTLRRTYASWRTAAGMGLVHLQSAMGHASVEQTRRYVDTNQIDAFSNAAPLIDGHKEFRG